MEKQVVVISAEREGYSFEQIRSTMTAGELIEYLEQFDEDAQVYLSHDNGYTYGGITWDRITEEYTEDEDAEDEDAEEKEKNNGF